MKRIEELNNDDSVDGILVQLPVPGHINERKVCNSVSCDKDVDGFNERNIGRLCLDMNTLIPCTPLGVQELIKRTEIETFGKNAVVVGRSKNVGMPIAMLLHADGRNDTCAMDATVTMCHRFTPPEDLARFCRTADIIVTATGVPGLIKADMVKEGAAIIDVGITRVTDPVTGKNKLVGDVDFEGKKNVRSSAKCARKLCKKQVLKRSFFPSSHSQFLCRGPQSGRPHYASAGWCRTNDGCHVDEEYFYCGEEFGTQESRKEKVR